MLGHLRQQYLPYAVYLAQCKNLLLRYSLFIFVIGRKNWLFSASTKGADSSALLYSIIETAKGNGLVIEKYLLYLMNQFVKINPADKESLLKILPFSKDLPDDLKVKTK